MWGDRTTGQRGTRELVGKRGTDLKFHAIIICCIVIIPSAQQLAATHTYTHTHTTSDWDMPEIVVVMVKVWFSWPEP